MTSPPRLDLVLGNLRIDVKHVGQVRTIHLSGELDSFSAPELRSALSDELRSRPKVLALDLSELRFLGVSGLEALLRARRVAARSGTALIRTGHARPSVTRLLDLMGWELTSVVGGDQVPRKPGQAVHLVLWMLCMVAMGRGELRRGPDRVR